MRWRRAASRSPPRSTQADIAVPSRGGGAGRPAAAESSTTRTQIRATRRASPRTFSLPIKYARRAGADLALAPDEETGFAMTLLRLLAFDARPCRIAAPKRAGKGPLRHQRHRGRRVPTRRMSRRFARSAAPAPEHRGGRRCSRGDVIPLETEPSAWPAFVAKLKLSGMAAQLAAQTELKSMQGNALTLALPASHKHLADKAYADKLKASARSSHGQKAPACVRGGRRDRRFVGGAGEKEAAPRPRRWASSAFRDEPFVRDLMSRFDGRINPDTIEPIGNDRNK